MDRVLAKFTGDANLASIDWDEVVQNLVDLTRHCQQDEENRVKLDISVFTNLGRLLDALLDSELPRDKVFLEMYRFLRNSVVACRKNQDAVRENSVLYDATRRFLQVASSRHKAAAGASGGGGGDGSEEKDKDKQDKDNTEPPREQGQSSEEMCMAIRCSLQFLANTMVENSENTAKVTSMFVQDLDTVINTFHDDEKIVQYVAMVVHLVLKGNSKELVLSPSLIERFLQNLHFEFVIYAVESFVLLDNLADIYESIEPPGRIRLLSFLNARSDLLELLNETVTTMITRNFIERSDFILRSQLGDSDDIFCWEIAVLLETLCTLSLTDKAANLKSDQVLLTTLLCLLKQIHELGKLGGNTFSIDEDMGKLTSKSSATSDLDDIRAHPTFQFKAHLIRLIGNLVYKSVSNQDKVRELECIPIILDCCKIDARNPFIAQWSVLAIRNLCDGNEDNQAFIREVQRVDTEKILPTLELIKLSN